MANIKEHYHAKPMAVNSSLPIGVVLAGFLCTIAGTLTITDADGTVIINALPVSAGVFTRIPLLFNTSAGGIVVLSAGAAGTLFL